jgi:hypothetical protein
VSSRAAALVACAAGALTGLPASADADPLTREREVPALAPLPALAPARALKPLHALPRQRLTPLRALAARSRALARRWRRAFRAATTYARRRLGRISIALVDDQGRLHRFATGRRYHSASLVKAMLLVAYLRRRELRGRALPAAAQKLLSPMIRRSDNDAATHVRGIVGNAGLARLARRAGMRHFATAPSWGDSEVAAADQARFFMAIDRLVPPRHRAYARLLLSRIATGQRWGIPEAAPPRTRVFFKGGWRPEGGAWLVHQAAFVEGRGRRASLVVLTDRDRSEGYGHETIRGVAAPLLRVLAQ